MKRFMTWLATASCLLSVILIAGCGSESKGDLLSSTKWDAEYDVVVVGFGGAGAVSAVTAADAGSKVLLLEKAPVGEEGGNTRYALQLVLIPKDRAAAITYFKGLRGQYDNQSDEVINFIVDGAMENRAWFEKMGIPSSRLKESPMVEYPELAGAREGVGTYMIDGLEWQGTLWQFLRGLVYDRQKNIDIWYESPATRLIQDKTTKIVHGVIVKHDGKNYNIRAKNGVVLAAGGFENNDIMLENYAQLSNAYSKGARYNTGDGITMAQDVGADLWHMSALSGPDVNFVNPATGTAMFYFFNTIATARNFTGFGRNSMIVVGGSGRRFMNDNFAGRHGHVEVAGTWFSLQIPQNSWCVFDETARLATPAYAQWSEGMEEEIAKGWIIKADSVQALAEKMKINPSALSAEVAKYNGYCRDGADPEFGRDAQYLKPLVRGPYYAFPVHATLTNTQGGPKRNTNCEIVDPWGTPIPHLYGAGELGSFYTDVYNGGSNLSECLFTGRTAGKNAAAAKKDVSSASVLSKGTPISFNQKNVEIPFGENEYLGVATGMNENLTVKVKMDGKQIVSVDVVKHNETPGLSDNALIAIPKAIVEQQSTQVDVVSGASNTSRGIMRAAQSAIDKAK